MGTTKKQQIASIVCILLFAITAFCVEYQMGPPLRIADYLVAWGIIAGLLGMLADYFGWVILQWIDSDEDEDSRLEMNFLIRLALTLISPAIFVLIVAIAIILAFLSWSFVVGNDWLKNYGRKHPPTSNT